MITEFLENQFVPTTCDIGFIDQTPENSVREFIKWQQPLLQARGIQLTSRQCFGDLSDTLNLLYPLTSIERRRYLFVPTKSRWTAYFDNGLSGGDPASSIAALCELYNHKGIRMNLTSHANASVNKETLGSVIFEMYGPIGRPILNTDRSIFVAHNGSSWEFGESGSPLPFEQLDSYKLSNIRDRFSPELLRKYLAELDIYAFDPSFYFSTEDNPAFIVEKTGPMLNGVEEYFPNNCNT